MRVEESELQLSTWNFLFYIMIWSYTRIRSEDTRIGRHFIVLSRIIATFTIQRGDDGKNVKPMAQSMEQIFHHIYHVKNSNKAVMTNIAQRYVARAIQDPTYFYKAEGGLSVLAI